MQADGLPRSVSQHFSVRKHFPVSAAGPRGNPPANANRWAFQIAENLRMKEMLLKHIEKSATMKIRILAILLALPLLTSCGGKAEAPVLSPSAVMVKENVTPTLISTQTLLPTPSFTITVTRTPYFFPTTRAEATEQVVAKQYCGDSLNFPHPNGFLPSKSGKLMAFVCWPSDGKDISVTRVIALDGSRPPVQASYRKDYLGIDYSQHLPKDIQDMLESLPPWIEYFALYPWRWTADDRFLYLARQSPADGIPYPPNIFGLMRLNVDTGEVTTVLPQGSYYCDFSADGTKLLYVDGERKHLIAKVQNLVTGDEISIHLDKRFDDAGLLRLSPDGSKLLISAVDYEADGKRLSIILADLHSTSQIYLDNDYDYYHMSWVDEHTIYGSGQKNGFFYLDTRTMKTRPAPDPTPIPTSTPRE